jgi:aromatic ring-opening dioxygenase catalytic subunit (LigB family)
MAQFHRTMQLGELIAAAFDEAGFFSSDPLEVSQLAAGAVMHVLEHSRRPLLSRAPEWRQFLEWRAA